MFYYNRSVNQLVPFSNPALSLEKHKIANRITALFMDRQENMWIGSYDNGLEKLLLMIPFSNFIQILPDMKEPARIMPGHCCMIIKIDYG